MKKKTKHFLFVAIIIISCNTKSETSSTAITAKDETSTMGNTAIDNAGKAKRPKGALSCTIDGENITATENTVQCMYIGMGNASMAQGMITGNVGNIQISAIMMTKPEIATLKGDKIGATVGITITKNGEQYSNMLGGEITIDVTKIKPDGKNYYIGGTFSGVLKSKEGKTITVTNGIFESAYL